MSGAPDRGPTPDGTIGGHPVGGAASSGPASASPGSADTASDGVTSGRAGPRRGVVLVPVADPAAVAGAAAALPVEAVAVPVEEAGVLLVLGAGTDPADAAGSMSRLMGRADLLLLVRGDGRLDVTRWVGGRQVDAPPPGLALSALPDGVERLLLSDAPADGEPGAVPTAGVPRVSALRAAMALQRAGADPAAVRRVRRMDRIASAVVAAAMVLLLVLEVPRLASGDGGSWLVVVLAVLALAWSGWRLAVTARRPAGASGGG